MSASNERRIVIVGKTGTGKSHLANTIFGEDVFKISHTFSSETRQCQSETRSVNGRSVTLIDTPGFFDTDRSEEEMKPEIVSCITECAPGPHAFLIVLKVERFTEQEQEVIIKIQEYFSEEALKYATVVFTHGDQLPEGETIEKLVSENEAVDDLVKKCGGRCHVVDNKSWKDKPKNEYRSNQFQVEELLKTIDKMVTENNGGYYTNGMLQVVKQMMNKFVENIKQLSRNMTVLIKKAKDSVYKVLIRLTDIGTGVFIGAFLGVAVMVAVVITALKTVPVSTIVNTADIVARGLGPRDEAGTAGVAVGAVGAVGAVVAPVIFGVAVGASAAVGAVRGGVKGYHAAEGAETPWEAATRAAEA